VDLGGWRPVARGDIMGSWATARPPRHWSAGPAGPPRTP